MSTNKATASQGLRLMLIAVLLALFCGGIMYSARSIRYKVDGKPATEYTITKLSLTHEVEPTADGKLTNPYAESALPHGQDMLIAKANGLPVVLVASAKSSNQAQELAAKKTAPKKPAPKKPEIKKPSPKKPDPKKPAKKPKPKACPT